MKFTKYFKNELAFTLIEMMIVLMIISVLLLIALPNMTKNNELAQKKGCEATVGLLQAQVGAYQIEKGVSPGSLEALKNEDYVDTVVCPDGTSLVLSAGKVVRVD